MKRKRLAYIGLAFLFTALLTACQAAGAEIEPGDKIGGMEFINDHEQCQAPNLNELCSFQSLFEGSCEIPASVTQFWISSGWTEGSQEALELAWKDSVWHMAFDGHTIDLQAFGTIDIQRGNAQLVRFWDVPDKTDKEIHRSEQKTRMWGICVSNPTPGVHTVTYDFYLKNGIWRGQHEEMFTFTVLAAEPQ